MCYIVRPGGHRGDDDLGFVTDRTGRVHGRTVTTSSRGTRGRHSISDLLATPTPLAPGFYHGTGPPGSSTQPPAVLFRSRPPLQPHLSHTPVPYEAYGSTHPPSHLPNTVYDPYLHAPTIRPRISYRSAAQEPILEFSGQPRQIGVDFFYQMIGTTPHDSSCSTHGYSHIDFGVSSSEPYIGRPVYRVCKGDRGIGEEHDRVRSLHIKGEADQGGDDDGDSGDGNQDEGEDAGDEEQPVPVAPASGSNGHPHHGKGKGKGLTGNFMSMMSKISGSRNKRPNVAREVLAPTQRRKKVKASNWEQTCPADGGPIDPELIPSYGGHVRVSYCVDSLVWFGAAIVDFKTMKDLSTRSTYKCSLQCVTCYLEKCTGAMLHIGVSFKTDYYDL
ncbi:hypothetical protein M9H77_17780 [Catharanthus roseus]|uniref:Uncharacterized protein n=1 Tax=Catharanthus roseus TaxID=4058 RepID=A0ACC0B5T0_CATRO|nr:hypothetical protein M9H77_17780 [Catharanthus roseus]